MKRIAKGFERILWIVVGAALTALVTQWIESKSPDIVVRQYYNTVDTKASVPSRVGELVLEYAMSSPSPQPSPQGREGVYLVTVQNEGNGAEEDLSFQVTFEQGLPAAYYKEPDLKVFGPKETVFADGRFFTELEKFPVNALAEVSFVSQGNTKTLCNVDIKIAGKTRMGRVEGIKGVRCE